MNQTSEHEPERATLTPIDSHRHALEARIEHAKDRLVDDLNRATALVRQAASAAGRSLLRVALLGAVVVVGIVAAFVRRRRRRRLRVTWK